MSLSRIKCPSCGEVVSPKEEVKKRASSYDDCLRRCEKCEVGFSNSNNKPTIIYKNYLHNVPELVREGLEFSLDNSMNEINRKNKKNKFGFSTSEDALTWSFFNYFVVTNQLQNLLKIMNIKSKETDVEIYLWGTCIYPPKPNSNLIENFITTSNSFNESESMRTEPDVIINLKDTLVFIEVKYLSSNEISNKKEKFENYIINDFDKNEIIESGHYELARNWAFVSKLSNGKNFELVNLGLNKLFFDKNKNKLHKFENALKSDKGTFRKISWEEVLTHINTPEFDYWFKDYLINKIQPANR
ncbi:hypothetical protein EZY14_010775 [Kordia sp. TARA_039_SRF]|nr:hypothetical protein EZY14_010775 [Kordia sp. TARA_039_SRF]